MTAKNKTDLGAEVDALITTNATGDVTAAKVRTLVHDVVDSMSTATDAAPDTSLTIDNGSYRGKFRVGPSSKVEVATGLAGTADASLHAAIMIDPVSGQVSFPSGGSVAGMTGAGSGSITGGGLGFRFDSRASAISATITSVASGGPNWIATAGYATPGDGGGGLYIRASSTPSYSSLVWFTSADGQKWALALSAEPLRIEQAGGGTSASGATNSAAIDAIHSIFYTNKGAYPSGYTYAGPNIKFGPGTYNFAGPYFIKGASQISGSGSGMIGGYSTELVFPVNSDGIVLGAAGTNGRLYNPSIYGDYDGRGTIIRDISIKGGWNTSATTYWQNQTTGQRGYGILSKAIMTLENVHVSRFAEHGIYIKGTAGGGGSATEPAVGTADNTDTSESYICSHGYANNFTFTVVQSETNGGDGYRDRGADANAGSYINCSATENGGCGFNSLNFLGNWFWGCHSATNGIRQSVEPNSGKIPCAYHVYGSSQFTQIEACYSEGGQPGSVFQGFSMVIGGLHAAGSPNQSGSSNTRYANGGTGGAFLSGFRTPTDGGDFTVGSVNVNGEILNFGGEIFWRKEFSRLELGTFGRADSFALTLSGYGSAQGRASNLGSGETLLPHGVFLGGPQINTGFDQRFTGMSDGLPTAGQWARGDFIRMVNPSAGGAWAYVCTSGGDYAATPPVWKSVGNLAA